jgi:hypothetical protein
MLSFISSSYGIFAPSNVFLAGNGRWYPGEGFEKDWNGPLHPLRKKYRKYLSNTVLWIRICMDPQ